MHVCLCSMLTKIYGHNGWHKMQPIRYGGDGGGHCLVRMEWRPDRWSVCLPLLIFPCTINSRGSLLAPVHPGSPGKRAVKRLWYIWPIVAICQPWLNASVRLLNCINVQRFYMIDNFKRPIHYVLVICIFYQRVSANLLKEIRFCLLSRQLKKTCPLQIIQ